MKEVTARFDISVYVSCPGCDYLIDLMDESDTDGHALNEEDDVINQACPDGAWIDKHREFEISHVTCSECKGKFNVKGLEW